jgi:DNA polymerase-4
VRAASIDEQYVDFHGCERMYKKNGDEDDDATILRVVREITATIQAELGLPSSAGIAVSKPMAKVASGLAKPRGVLMVRAGSERATLAPLPLRKLPGIGPVCEAKLHAAGITTIGQIETVPDAVLRKIFGSYTAGIRRAAHGIGTSDLGRERPAFQEHDPRGELIGTISNERTFVETSAEASMAVLSSLCERVAYRARRRGVLARTVTLKLRYTDFHTITRARTIAATSSDVELHRAVVELYRRARTRELPIRLLGVALSKLEPCDQLPLFDGGSRRDVAVDDVRDKFGYDALHLGSTLRGG